MNYNEKLINIPVYKPTVMKKLAFSVLTAVITLVGFASCGGGEADNKADSTANDSTTKELDTPDTSKVHAHEFETTLNIRYIDLEKIIDEYNYAQQEYKKLNDKNQNLNVRGRQLDNQLTNKANSIQQKGNSNGYTSQQEYEKDMADFQALQQSASKEMTELQEKFQKDQIEAQAAIMKSIENKLTEYNNEKHYDAILMKSSGIFNPKLEITDEIIALLNGTTQAAPAEKAEKK